ncbi:manganese efflux pump MntP [Clostridium septicum]|uniref:Putative manganese efflux pump MntP n=1 Tax=Clostridium septicum TaxID=1504 RepID=A0A9N7PLV2_CLOSE|nr:manganese efflux pump MntP family protein [Clostridium septicum]AYE35131.1 manganese efflux pump MntP [Clostridium septicum]MDU1314230.1 manganese efflux pump MntP family protein [Clostridium septicum]QAS60523.1 manganese efflux pump MntP family protein [Clostridium septicum]UEC20217.1 manganese efflux pump MntP family protein [Clostridium septicum]USS01729.1 manganese efflux pump MntP family protein [Clostridium septicum]
MSFLSIFMMGIGLSMDAFAVALAKGMNLRKNLTKNAMKIAIFFGVFQGVMPLIGWWAGRYFESYIKSFDHWIAFILLGIIGGKMIYESVKGENEDDIKCDEIKEEVSVDTNIEENEELNNKNLIILAIATSIDALAVGVSFAFLSVNIAPAITIIGLITFTLCIIAVLIGKKIGGLLQKYAEIIGGVILILIGTKILIEHLFM